MPLSTPAAREKIHTRTITLEGFKRGDGLWDIEGSLTDVKTVDFANAAKHRPAGTFLHEMRARLTIDADFNPDIRAAHICLAMIGLGRKEDALRSLRTYLDAHPKDPGGLVTSVEAILHALFQRQSEAEEAIQRAAVRRGAGHFHHTQYHIACAYALMNKKDLALEWLRKSSAEGFSCYPLFERDGNLANLKGDPRFVDLLAVEKKRHGSFKEKYGIKGGL